MVAGPFSWKKSTYTVPNRAGRVVQGAEESRIFCNFSL
jgi:hypothetical protein